MDEVTIYHNNRCSKSRGALKLLEEKGIEPKIRYYLEEVPTESEIKEILRKLGMRAKDLVRRTENVYKEDYRGKTLSEEEWVKIMTEHPRLIERPIIIKGEQAIIGRPPENIEEIL